MKITKVATTAESRRRPNPIRDALQWLDTEGTCRVVIETSEGVTGRSAISFGRGDRASDILAHLINEELAPAVVGDDAFLIRAIRDKLWKLTDAFNVPYASHGGGAHLHVLATLQNTLFMESGLLREGAHQRLVDGCYLLPEEPGLGGQS